MTGPEHYRVSESLVKHSQNHTDQGNGADDKIAELAAAQAQVHATLALAAAQAAFLNDPYIGDGDHINAWQTAIS